MCDYNRIQNSILKIEDSDLSTKFFNNENVEEIQYNMKYAIKSNINETIGDQSVNHLLSIMNYVYKEYGKHLITDIDKQIDALNAKVLEICIPMIISGIKQYKNYLHDASQLYVPMERSMSTTIKGENNVEFKSFF